MPTDGREVIRKFVEEVWNAHNAEAVDKFASSDYVDHDPFHDEPVKGPDGLKKLITGYLNAFSDVHIAIDELLADGNQVTMRWTGTGTHDGELRGIPPTHRKATVGGISIYRIVNDRIAETYTYWDTLGLLQQLGVFTAKQAA